MSNWTTFCLAAIGFGFCSLVVLVIAGYSTRPATACGDFRTAEGRVIRVCGERVR